MMKRLKLIKTKIRIRWHLRAQYNAWSAIIYSDGRIFPRSRLVIHFKAGTPGYRPSKRAIYLFVPDGNIDELEKRGRKIEIIPNKDILYVTEIDLLHEMMHERQYRENTPISNEGRSLYERFKYRFSGPGHDMVFFSAIAVSAPSLKVSPSDLVNNI